MARRTILTGRRYKDMGRTTSPIHVEAQHEERRNSRQIAVSNMADAAKRAAESGLKNASGKLFAESFTRDDDGLLLWA